MLPVSITGHPYFHENLDEPKAKAFLLSEETKANMLFIKSEKNNEFMLCYKAYFRNGIEFRVLKFIFDRNQKLIRSTSLGSLTTLYSISQELPRFLAEYASGFKPIPAYKESRLIKLLNPTESFPVLNSLSRDIINNIFSKLNVNSLFIAMQVSKGWYSMIHSDTHAIIRQHDYEQNEKQGKDTFFIFEFIKKELDPDLPGKGKDFKRLTHNGLVLSEPEWYGSKIKCRIDLEGFRTRYLIISPISFYWSAEMGNDDLSVILIDACKFGIKSTN